MTSSCKKLSEQFKHWTSRLFAITSVPPHFGQGEEIGRFQELNWQVG